MANQFPTWGGPRNIERLSASASFARLHVTIQEQVRALIEASEGRVGLGVGWRSAEQQRRCSSTATRCPSTAEDDVGGKRWRKKASHLATSRPAGALDARDRIRRRPRR